MFVGPRRGSDDLRRPQVRAGGERRRKGAGQPQDVSNRVG